MSDTQKDLEKAPEGQDLLSGQQKLYAADSKPSGCCRCTKKRLIILAIILVMMLLYGLGLAIGLAVGLSKDKEGAKEKVEEGETYVVGAVVSDHEACSDIGRDILARSGTAVDAAIATLICLGVRQPHSMGIGGGCFMLVYDKYENKTTIIDGRETSPRYLKPEDYMNMTKYNVNARRIAVPGELKAYQGAYTRYGRLPWKDLFEPTIKMIRDGFPLSEATANALAYTNKILYMKTRGNLSDYPVLCSIYCADTKTGEPKKEGDIIHWPKLGDTLQGIADKGVDYIYNSPLTNTIVDEIQKEGGMLDIADFIIDYKIRIGEPIAVEVDKFNATVNTMDGATGGPIVGLILNILKGYNEFDTTSAEGMSDFYHKFIEAIKFSDADRQRLGDPDFDNTTSLLKKMQSEMYADVIREKITDMTHDISYYTEASDSYDELMGTSHLSVLSPYGDAVSVTSTVNWYFGSMIMSNSTGIIWNNEMDDFDSPTQKLGVNQLQPGKRPRSSMAPVIVVDRKNNVKLVTGGAGGSRIATTVAQILASILLLEKPLKEAVDDKRLHHILSKNLLILEKNFPADIKQILEEKKGHKTEEYTGDIFSVVESIQVDNEGVITGYADKRKGKDGKTSYMYRTKNKKRS